MNLDRLNIKIRILIHFLENAIYVVAVLFFSIMLQSAKVCLLLWGLSSHSRIFHSYGDVAMVRYTYVHITEPTREEVSITCRTTTGVEFSSPCKI